MNLKDILFVKQNNAYSWFGKYGQIDLLVYESSSFDAVISIQGAQLLHWQPKDQAPIIFTSPESDFIKGMPIRGGIPICWPWFGKVNMPAHGFARLCDWQIESQAIDVDNLNISLSLDQLSNAAQYIKGDFKVTLKLEITSEKCDLSLSYQSIDLDNVTSALHTYFYIGKVNTAKLKNIGTVCLDKLKNEAGIFSDPRQFDQAFDAIYPKTHQVSEIIDTFNLRTILVDHHQASNIVIWNPWQDLDDMSLKSSQTMLCVESAYLDENMSTDKILRQTISYKNSI